MNKSFLIVLWMSWQLPTDLHFPLQVLYKPPCRFLYKIKKVLNFKGRLKRQRFF